MLTKPPFAAYVLAPLVVVAARIRARRALANLALAALIGGGLGLPWYGPRLLGLAPEIASRSFRQAAEAGHPEPRTPGALPPYPRWFPLLLGVAAAPLSVPGCARCAAAGSVGTGWAAGSSGTPPRSGAARPDRRRSRAPPGR